MKVDVDFADEYPDGEPASTEAYATLVRTGAALAQEIDRCMAATFGVSHAVLTALAVIDGADGPLTPSEISERTLVSSGTMTGTLDQLEYRSWVRRTPNPDDRRSVLVEVTDAGKAIADQLLPGIRNVEKAVFARLTAAQVNTLLELLGNVLHSAATVAAAEPIVLDGRRNRPQRLR